MFEVKLASIQALNIPTSDLFEPMLQFFLLELLCHFNYTFGISVLSVMLQGKERKKCCRHNLKITVTTPQKTKEVNNQILILNKVQFH